jgi:mannose-1-phosphate guanylyltransferase
MKALVLAAGFGERLRPLTNMIPKPLLEIGGHPLIHYPLLLLRDAGIRQIAINLHHLAANIRAALGSGDKLGVDIIYLPEASLQGTGGPLVRLRGYFGSEPFLILNSDTIMDLDLPAMIASHRERGATTTMALRHPGESDAYSRIEIDDDGRVRRIRLLTDRLFQDYPPALVTKPGVRLRPLMYCGAMICEPAVFEIMPTTPPFSLIVDVVAPMVSKQMPVFGYVHEGFFRTVDDLESYNRICNEFKASPPPLPFMTHQQSR